MKAFFVFFLVTVIISVSKADYKPILDIHRGGNISDIPSSRIIEGTPAALGAFPYQTRLILYQVYPVENAFCGGSIISRFYVLTAAHCIIRNRIPFTAITIEAGSVEAGKPAQSFTVYAIHFRTHPKYDYTNFMYDVGLIYNDKSFIFGPNVKAIALPDFNPNADMNEYVNEYVTISGFGWTSNTGPSSPVLLYTKTLRGISFDDCQSYYGYPLPNTAFCVVDNRPPVSAICNEDSGDPVALIINNKVTLIGVVVYGPSRCDAAPQGMTHVALIKDWITRETGITL